MCSLLTKCSVLLLKKINQMTTMCQGPRPSTYFELNSSKNKSKKEIRGGPSLDTRVVRTLDVSYVNAE